MISAATVLVCALEVLGRDASTLPPVELLAEVPRGVSQEVEAFVRPGSGVITLLTTSDAFDEAQRTHCRAYTAILKLASILVHEEWHVLNGADERGAYEAQLSALLKMNVPPESALYIGVLRSMMAASSGARKDAARR